LTTCIFFFNFYSSLTVTVYVYDVVLISTAHWQ